MAKCPWEGGKVRRKKLTPPPPPQKKKNFPWPQVSSSLVNPTSPIRR